MEDSAPKRHKPVDHETLDGGDGDKQQEEDRISNLPDSILSHILSKLPTKHAVATAVLSTKWKHLFPQIPNLTLDIDDSLLLHPHHHDADDDTNPVSHRINTNFVNFMYHLLTVTLRDVPCVRNFLLHCNHDYGNSHIDAWISTVLSLNVTSLILFFRVENTGVSIPSIFHSTTLVNLLWTQHCVVNVPSTVFMPNLKQLFLDFVQFVDEESFERVLDGCPVLEELSLTRCEFEDTEILRISSPSLKLLMLNSCQYEGIYDVEIDTPKLELLHYDDYVAGLYHGMSLKSLCKAHIDIGPSDEQVEEADDEDLWRYDSNVAELVAACCNVEFLYLSMASVAAIHRSSRPLPTFHNLTELKLGDLSSHGWELLPHFLESAPTLEIIVFAGGISEHIGCFTKFQSSLPENVPGCLSLHLQSICFEEFNGEQDELELVRYFLETAEVLRKMEFSFRSSLPPEKQFCTWGKLFLLQRCSKNCKMEFADEVETNVVDFCRIEGRQKMERIFEEIATASKLTPP